MIKTLEWTDAGVRFIDQTKLPTEETYVTCTTYEEVADAIRTMIVRGAPAIGVSAAMGIALGVRDSKARDHAELNQDFDRICEALGATRPTAVNLFWAIRRMKDKFDEVKAQPLANIRQTLVSEAQQMLVEDIATNQAMGKHGAVLLPANGSVLTHCNAGALCAGGYGTALGVIRAAIASGKETPCVCRRNPAVSPGLTSDSVGVDEGWHSHYCDFRQYGRRHHAAGKDWRRYCGSRPHCRQW